MGLCIVHPKSQKQQELVAKKDALRTMRLRQLERLIEISAPKAAIKRQQQLLYQTL